jgi:hypothetical protein
MDRAQRRGAVVPVLSTLTLGVAGGLILASVMTTVQLTEGTPAILSDSTARAAVPTVNCPTVSDKLPPVPASAAREVRRNLTRLKRQIDEANRRLAGTAGQGGTDLIQNAVLGPLRDKRVATINRIATAIGRTTTRPSGLDALATCTLFADRVSGSRSITTPAVVISSISDIDDVQNVKPEGV